MKNNESKKVTLLQVAEHAGVSKSTVSLILQGNTRISEATRVKVLDSIQQLGYIYDRNAANLRSKQRPSTVGLLISEIANPFFSRLLAGLQHKFEQEDYTVILGTTHDSCPQQDKLLSNLLEYRVSGIILSPASGSTKESFEQIINRGVPVVLVTKEPENSRYDYVGSDYVLGGQMAVEHLIQKGHKRIAYLGGPPESSSWKDRKLGYYNALNQAGIKIDDTLIVNGPVTREGGVEAIKKVLSHSNPPTAAFCFNDVIALGVMKGLKDAGLTPGQDFGIVGYDDNEEATYSDPGLTTIKGHPGVIGAQAANLLHQRIIGTLDNGPQRIIIDPELVVREST
jgi:LacI family transcriptional regulator